jgi:drug/metabolite transporter (DMT)-like permease
VVPGGAGPTEVDAAQQKQKPASGVCDHCSVLAFSLALLASVSWGVGDFLGGLKSRSLPLLVVLTVSQIVGLLAIIVVVAARGIGPPEYSFIPFAVAGGVAVAIGIGAFFRALAVGTMSVVAPISAVGSAVPVLYGVALGERPGPVQVIGIVLAVAGVVLAAREPPRPGEETARVASGAALAGVAALGFGCFLMLMHRASEGDAFWATLVQRIASMAVIAAIALVKRPSFHDAQPHLGGLATIGLLDVGAAVLFAVASSQGMVSLIAVMASLYPIATVLLAHIILGERLALTQRLGAGAAFAGVGLISLA